LYGGAEVPRGAEVTLGKRLDMHEERDVALFQQVYDGRVPCVLTNAYGSSFDPENWTQDMIDLLKLELVEYDARNIIENTLDTYECTLGEFVSALPENSDHFESIYLMSEDLLRRTPRLSPDLFTDSDLSEDMKGDMDMRSEELREHYEQVESLTDRLKLPTEIFGTDYFQHFPSAIRPQCALVVGGCGSRSFLHADPYEWTGYNYLFGKFRRV